MAHQIVWCDIPVLNLDRAIRFYSAVLGAPVKKEEFPGMTIGILPHQDGEVAGCLYTSDKDRPSDHGPLFDSICSLYSSLCRIASELVNTKNSGIWLFLGK